MTIDATPQQSGQPGSTRKPYRSPALRRYGTVHDLTQAQMGGDEKDGGGSGGKRTQA